MSLQHIAPHGRLLANALTFALAAFGACGWVVDTDLQLPARIALGVIAVLTQQLANLTAAGAAIAYREANYMVCAGAIVLTAVLGGGGGYSVAHAHQVFDALGARAALAQHADVRLRVERELEQIRLDRTAAATALRAIPPNIPARRIVALQAPLNDAIARADARRAELEQRLNSLSQPPAPTADEKLQAQFVAIWFWALALAEPGIYWLMASLSQPVPARPGTGVLPKERASARVPLRPSFRARVAALIAGVATIGGATAPAAHAPVSHSCPSEAAGDHGSATDMRHDGGQLLRQAQALHARGLSLRQIARTLGVRSKSTFQRMLAAAQAPDGES